MAEKLTALILYKDHTYKIIDCDVLMNHNLRDPKISVIFVPNLESPNSYIPIKPSIYYKFSKCVVRIVYQGFVTNAYEDIGYNMEDVESDFIPKEHYSECYNLVEFINAIYNLWKFRGTSIFLSENNNSDSPYAYDSWIIYPRYYSIKFYDARGRIKTTIDSGELLSIPEKYADKTYSEIPIEFCQEEYMEPIRDIFFTPLCNDDVAADGGYFGLLPRMICLDADAWLSIKKPGRELSPLDYVLVKIEDYGIYYYTQYGVYESFLNIAFDLQIYAGSCTKHDGYLLQSLDKKKVPSMSEKMEAIDAFDSAKVMPTIDILTSINSPIKVIEILLFLRNIMSSMHYLLYDIFGEPTQEEIEDNPNEGCRNRVLAIFNTEKQAPNIPKRILSELELSDERIQNAILSFIKEEL